MTTKRTMAVSLFLLSDILGGAGVALASTPSIDPSVLTGRAAVDAFLRAHAGEFYDDAVLGDFRVIDLDHDGRSDLIATIDCSGRRFFNHLLVLHDDGEKLTVQEVDIWNMESLDGAVQDLNGDGQPEILLRQNLTPYLGARPMASWTAIFRFDGTKLVDQSALFPSFYDANVLPRIAHKSLETNAGDPEYIYRKDALAVERDKILRILGRFPNAGLGAALRWARSEEPIYRIFALSILSDIGGSEALSALAALGEDRDPEVAARARVAIAMKGTRGVSP